MNPQAPQQSTCITCHTLLAHPPTSLYIQCPKCFTIMNARESNNGRTQTNTTTLVSSSAAGTTPNRSQAPANSGLVSTFGGVSGSLPPAESAQFALQQAQSKLKPKKKRDPMAPKAASNAYMIFCKEMRPKLKKDNTELSFGKIGARLGEMWRSLPSEAKKVYFCQSMLSR